MQPGREQSVSNHFPPLYHVAHIPLFLSLALSFMISCSYRVYTYSFHPLPFLALHSLVSTYSSFMYLLPPHPSIQPSLLTQMYIHSFPVSRPPPTPPPPPSLPPPPHLNASWSPRYKLSQLSLPDALQALVDLGGVHLPLDDVQDGDVAVVVSTVTWSRHHHILWLRGAGYILKVSQDTR